MEAARASEATKKAVPANMHIDGRVIEVVWIKSEVKFDLHGFWGWLEVAMASEVAYWTHMNISIRVIEAADSKYQAIIEWPLRFLINPKDFVRL